MLITSRLVRVVMLECDDCHRKFGTERALRTHQGKVHGSVLGPHGGERKGPRRKRCTCDACGFVHPPLRQFIGFPMVPLLDPDTKGAVRNPETGELIEIFDALRSIDPGTYAVRTHPLSGSFTRFEGSQAVAVGTFQEEFPDPDLPGVRCLCPRCGHLHLRR